MIKNEIIKKLVKERAKLTNRIQKIATAIKALQDICEHDYVEDGHDSHKDHYICKICFHKDSW